MNSLGSFEITLSNGTVFYFSSYGSQNLQYFNDPYLNPWFYYQFMVISPSSGSYEVIFTNGSNSVHVPPNTTYIYNNDSSYTVQYSKPEDNYYYSSSNYMNTSYSVSYWITDDCKFT